MIYELTIESQLYFDDSEYRKDFLGFFSSNDLDARVNALLNEYWDMIGEDVLNPEIIKNIKEIRIDTINWKIYKLVDIFDIKRGKRLRSIDRTKGNLRYFSSTSENNGVSCYIGNPLFIENNSLIFNTFGNVFYSEEEFSGSDEITILQNIKLNNKNGFFLSTI